MIPISTEGREVLVIDNNGHSRRQRYHNEHLARLAVQAMDARPGANEDVTFREFTALWCRYHAEARFTADTLACYKSTVDNHVLPFFGDLPLRSITDAHLREFIVSGLSTTGRGRSVTPWLVKLQAILGVAVKWGYLDENPVRAVDGIFLGIKEIDYDNH